MAFKSLGGSRIIGSGTPQAVPIQLDPAPYKGAIAYGSDGRVYVSNGTAWSDVGSGATGIQGIQGTDGVQGLQGTYGPGFDVIGSVPDVDSGGDPQATLNTAFASATTGQAVIDEADDELWVYDGTTWINVGSFRGVQGFQGTDGNQGLQGTIGQEGIQGSRGFRGYQGTQGIQGDTGIQGIQGIQGLQGTQGPQGVQGVQGDVGIQGIQGIQGQQSVQGIQGDTGIQGFDGFQGFSGDDAGHVVEFRIKDEIVEADPGVGDMIMNGAPNPTDNFSAVTKIWIDDEAFYGVNLEGLYTAIAAVGTANKGIMKVTLRNTPSNYMIFQIQGATDRTGYWELDVTFLSGDGVKGDFVQLDTPSVGTTTILPTLVAFSLAGDQGIQGLQGDQGTQGIQGVQGLLGIQGTQGAQAAQGIQGDTGIQGLQGTQGPQGIQGDQGLQGAQGLQGNQGFIGNQGIQGLQGHQGIQGDQGNQGIQGDVGTQGMQGTTGIQGTQGLQGSVGFNGGLTYEWNFDNDVVASTLPGTNNWKLNNADVTAATILTLDDIPLNNYTNDIDEVFDWLDTIPGGSGSKGLIVIESFEDGNGPGGHHQVVYEFTNFTWDGGGKNYGWFDVTYVGQYGLPNNDWDQDVIGSGHSAQTLINFVPRGEAGTQGITGIQGTQGLFGPQGIQGPQGVQGLQGLLGIQGAQGIAGAFGGASFEYDYTPDSTPTGPASGRIKFNNADITLGTILRINDITANGNDLDAFLATIADSSSAIKAYVKVISIADPTEYIVYGLTSATDVTTYYNLGVTFISKSVNMSTAYLTGNTDVIITVTRTGDQGIQGIQGDQGTQGVQGDLGFQGTTGAGTQGTTGIQGDLGFQGVQGFPGLIGPQGTQGTDGLQGGGGAQGVTGGFGGVTFDYTFSTNTAASDPGIGGVKFNNANISNSTLFFMDDRDDDFNDIQTFLRTIDDSTSPIKGHFKVSDKSDPSIFVICTISALTESSGYFEISSAYVNGSVTTFPDGLDVIVTFARTGDVGPAGIQGLQGFEGFQGPTGIQGDNGGLGGQGTQGFQGMQGFQGTSGFIGGDGIQGGLGPQGIQGTQGFGGTDGDSGIQGFQGTQGLIGTGLQGIQGGSGAQGFAGIGATGIQGFQGLQGIQQAGHQGVQGNAGPAGFGNQGIQGYQGPQGVDGDEGIQGLQGLIGIGEGGVQGIQGLDGDDGTQGFQGISGDGGNQGTQGFQGPAGIGDEGLQGLGGFQGLQGADGGEGPNGFQGVQGEDGPQGTQGIDGGEGTLGPQGVQGVPGDLGVQGAEGFGLQGLQGAQGLQGDLGVQGFPGQGTQGIQGTQAAQGVQGERGFQGTQGAQGFGPEGGITNIQNVHESPLQDTPLFLTLVEGGSTVRPLLATNGPNPGGESNFFYTSDADELTVENLQIEGNATIVGTLSALECEGVPPDLHFLSDQNFTLGGLSNAPHIKMRHDSNTGSMMFDMNTTSANKVIFYDATNTSNDFVFDMATGEFTAAGDIAANSDMRLKENIETISDALNKVSEMRGVYFDLKANPGTRKTGLIAQEVEKVLPEVVKTSTVDSNGEPVDNIKSVAYANVVGLLVEAIKELKDKVESLEKD